MPDSLRITMPLPPPELHAHAKGHWRSKRGPTKAMRERAYMETLACSPTPMERGEISFDIYFPDRRRRDVLNVIQGMKPAVDGIVDAGALADDDWQRLSIGHIRAHLDRSNPRIELTIEPHPHGDKQ